MARVVLLSGTSSSGKTSIAQRLASELTDANELWFHLEADRFLPRAPVVPVEHPAQADSTSTTTGLFDAAAAFVAAGNDTIIDGLLPDDSELRAYCLTALRTAGDVFIVGIHCELDEALRREELRGDRSLGTAQAQYDTLHLGIAYDCIIDTTRTTPQTAAAELARHVRQRWPHSK